MHTKHPLEQGLHNPKDKKYPLLHKLQTPAIHDKQFKGQQYPEVKLCVGEQIVQSATELQDVHPKAQALHDPNSEKVPTPHVTQTPATQLRQLKGQQYPAFKIY